MGAIGRFTGLVAPLALVLVAVLQVWGVTQHDLSQWKGGGFGMFSTVDANANRVLDVRLVTEEGAFPLTPAELVGVAPQGTGRFVSGTLTLPTDDRLDRIAELAERSAWYLDEQGAATSDPSSASPQLEVQAVEVTVYRPVPDRADQRLRFEPIAHRRLESPA
ncbi:MAG: hypothetical protein JJT89_15065 [Nitriliruptoraceae bacterium]|nr:hypothetical protein [Nitriliruptoraceae bacterium]